MDVYSPKGKNRFWHILTHLDLWSFMLPEVTNTHSSSFSAILAEARLSLASCPNGCAHRRQRHQRCPRAAPRVLGLVRLSGLGPVNRAARIGRSISTWLVVHFNHPEKYNKVNGKDDIPYYGKNKIYVWNHQPVLIQYIIPKGSTKQ